MTSRSRTWSLLLAVVAVVVARPAEAQTLSPRVALAEKKRVDVINKVKPSVVAVILQGGRNGGSGVLIDEEGFALTNWHVTSGANGPVMKCGLPDGHLYDAVLVGLDRVGDVALIKLLPKTPGQKFPFTKMGDSDKVKAGDWSLAMGNPFLLATDFTPTVTFGLVSGVHRYQYPAGTLLEYTDCIQIDTSINPGNSGGPLFSMDGEIIGINGRGSFEKRGRVNSGVGYAISINQIKNFLGHLRSGLETDHASIGASMESEAEDGSLSRILVKTIIDSDAKRRGLDVGDELVSFAGRPMTSTNQYKNVLGLYPKGWRMPIVSRRENKKSETLVRLMGVQKGVVEDRPGGPGRPVPPGPPAPIVPTGPASPASKFFKAKAGFANYYFNEVAQKRVLDGMTKIADYSKQTGDWTFELTGTVYTESGSGKDTIALLLITERGAADGKSPKVKAEIGGLDYPLEPLNVSEKSDAYEDPQGSGGFVLAMFLYRQMLVYGAKGFTRDFHHAGVEPFYPPTKDDKPDYAKVRVLAEVLRGKFAGIESRWFFAQADDAEGRWKKGQLIGFEVTPDKDKDPCEVCLSHYKDFGGRLVPSKMTVRRADKKYAEFDLKRLVTK